MSKIWRDLLPKDAVANMKLDAARFAATIEATDNPLAGAAIAAIANDAWTRTLVAKQGAAGTTVELKQFVH